MEKSMAPQIDPQARRNIDSWLKGDYDFTTKQEIERLTLENPHELQDAFYTHLKFGTGGLRGVMGVGTNRMNYYTVRAATQGLANYIKKQPSSTGNRHSVCIGYDCRLNSKEFAEETARVLSGNDIEVFLYSDLRPVASVSFGVLYHQCTAGIMITASHNPPKYNGYKVYWSYGGQVLPPHDEGIIEEVAHITEPTQVKTAAFPNLLIHFMGQEMDAAYLKTIHSCQLLPGQNHTHGKELKIVYTNLHGGGITMVPPALNDWGFTELYLVEEQQTPDGHFPTVKSPNPEDPAAMALGIEKLKACGADLLLGTDPDTDRVGVVVLHKNKPFFFDGNQIACMLLEHICSSLREQMLLPSKPMAIKTIVTTELFRSIASAYEVGCLDVLTGFKYVGEKIYQWEQEEKAHLPSHHFLFGAEESYGYLIGTHARDKDAVVTSASLAELALKLKRKGQTLVDFLHELYQKYGVYREKLLSLNFEGFDGLSRIQKLMHHLRQHTPTIFAGIPVSTIEDYLSHQSHHIIEGRKTTISLPKSDVIRLWLEDGTKIVVRPSGTEPKLKVYFAVHDKHMHQHAHALEKAIDSCDQKLDLLVQEVKKLMNTNT